MFDTFRVARRSQGLVASIEADRNAPDFDGDAAEAAGAADDSQSSRDDDAHLDAGDGSDDDDAGQGDADRSGADDDDDEEFDTEDEPDAKPEEVVKKLKNALRKAKGKLGKTRADRQLLKELRDMGFRPQDLYADSREYRRLQSAAAANPRLRALLSGGSDDDDAQPRGRSTDRRAARDTEEFQFDDSPEALGFDANASPANKAIAAGLKRAAQAEWKLDKVLAAIGDPTELVKQVKNLDQGFRSQSATTINTEWNGAIKAAAEQIKDKGVRALFQDAMLAAKQREAGKRPATFFVTHYLKLLNVTPAQAQRASQAAAQRGRVAQHVAGLPRQNAGNNGTPAPARKAAEKLADVHKRLRNVSAGR